MNKEEINAKRRACYKVNAEREKAYRKTHCKERRAYSKAYYEAHLKEIKIREKAHYQANKERIKAYSKAYYQLHKKKLNTRGKVWRKANPQKAKEASQKRRASMYKTTIETIKEKIVFLRDGWICQHCKKRVHKRLKYPNPMAASLDHIIPLSEGGTHTYKNVQLTHFICNASKFNSVLPQGEQLRMF